MNYRLFILTIVSGKDSTAPKKQRKRSLYMERSIDPMLNREFGETGLDPSLTASQLFYIVLLCPNI